MRSDEWQSGYQPEGLWRDFTVLDWSTLPPLMTESIALVGNPGLY
jgi:hypothetical protein